MKARGRVAAAAEGQRGGVKVGLSLEPSLHPLLRLTLCTTRAAAHTLTSLFSSTHVTHSRLSPHALLQSLPLRSLSTVSPSAPTDSLSRALADTCWDISSSALSLPYC